jgi:2-methylisocitrate lyase-like PEP mutase family enzyme
MTQADRARDFAAMHQKGNPLVLYNIWDAGGARAIADEGAKAIATGSWSVAAAHGYDDGQAIPLELLELIVGRIVQSVDLPVSVDFEGAYAVAPADVAANVARIIATGAVGINFEDQIVGGDDLHSITDQAARIAAARAATDVPIFINARTDLFLKEEDPSKHAALINEAKERATAYAEAGASGIFIPGLADLKLIAEFCDATALPVNVMMSPNQADFAELANVGIARASHGPYPYFDAIEELKTRYWDSI